MAGPSPAASRLWDAPTRLVHWGLVICLGFSWWSGETGRMGWHRWSGYVVVGLLVFRIVWGFAGSQTSRFSSFLKGPKATLAYARNLPSRASAATAGHNPLGAWSILAILLVLMVQTVSGLFAVDVDGLESGPLAERVSFEAGRLAARWHHWSFSALQALVALHIFAVVFYLTYKRTDLVGPMITGRRRFPQAPELAFAPFWRALAVAALAVVLAWWASKGLKV